MKRLLLAAVVFAVLGAVACLAEPDPGLLLELRIDKTVYEVGERVGYSLKTTSTLGTVKIERGRHRIIVTDKAGNEVGIRHAPTTTHWMTFGEELSTGESSTEEGVVNEGIILDSPGEYTATAEARGNYDAPLGISPFAHSAPVSFVVKAATPQNQEERFSAALKELSLASKPWEKQQAIADLGYTLDPRAVPELIKLARGEQTAYSATKALFGFLDKESRKVFISDLRANGPMSSWTTRDLAISFRLSDKQLAEILEYWFKHGNTQQRRNAVSCLPLVKDNELSEATKRGVVALLGDPDRDIRVAAVSILHEGKYGVSYDDILRVAEHDQSIYARGLAALSLITFRTRTEQTVQVLKTLLFSSDPVETAASALKATGTPSAKAVLEEGIKSTNPKIRDACEASLKDFRAR